MNQAGRTYLRSFLTAMALYCVATVVSVTLIQRMDPSVLRYLVAVLPILPVLFGLRAFLRFLDGMDELQRRIQLSGIAFAAGLTGIITFTYGWLELVGLPKLPMLWVFPLLIALWGIGVALASRRYQ